MTETLEKQYVSLPDGVTVVDPCFVADSTTSLDQGQLERLVREAHQALVADFHPDVAAMGEAGVRVRAIGVVFDIPSDEPRPYRGVHWYRNDPERS